MKRLLTVATFAVALAGCSAINAGLTGMSPKAGAVAVTLTDDAKKACGQQAVFNTVAGAAGIFGPQVAAGAAAASAAVGVGCVWVNS